MADPLRRPEQISPRSSPRDRGSRSPACPRPDSTGTLKTTISLGKNPSVKHTGPFYCVKDIPEQSEITGSTNLLHHYGLEHSYNKFCGKKVKEELSAFLPHLPGNIDTPGVQDNRYSSLRMLIEKPPITGKELSQLSGLALAGFRLHPGPLPEQYRMMHQMPSKKKKHKKHKKEGDKGNALSEAQTVDNASDAESRKPKKQKKEEEKDKDGKKKKKKEKKKKKQKHSPEHTVSHSGETGS